MKPLSDKQLETMKRELLEDGVGEIIDAQNVKDYIRKKRKKHRKVEEDAYNDEVDAEDADDILNALSLSRQESEKLLNQLSEEKVRKDNTSIADIDWKNVRTF